MPATEKKMVAEEDSGCCNTGCKHTHEKCELSLECTSCLNAMHCCACNLFHPKKGKDCCGECHKADCCQCGCQQCIRDCSDTTCADCGTCSSCDLPRVNRAGKRVFRGKGAWSNKYYCGESFEVKKEEKLQFFATGQKAIGVDVHSSVSDSICGPHSGRQCPECQDLSTENLPAIEGTCSIIICESCVDVAGKCCEPHCEKVGKCIGCCTAAACYYCPTVSCGYCSECGQKPCCTGEVNEDGFLVYQGKEVYGHTIAGVDLDAALNTGEKKYKLYHCGRPFTIVIDEPVDALVHGINHLMAESKIDVSIDAGRKKEVKAICGENGQQCHACKDITSLHPPIRAGLCEGDLPKCEYGCSHGCKCDCCAGLSCDCSESNWCFLDIFCCFTSGCKKPLCNGSVNARGFTVVPGDEEFEEVEYKEVIKTVLAPESTPEEHEKKTPSLLQRIGLLSPEVEVELPAAGKLTSVLKENLTVKTGRKYKLFHCSKEGCGIKGAQCEDCKGLSTLDPPSKAGLLASCNGCTDSDIFCCFTDRCRKPLCCGDVNYDGYLVKVGADGELYNCGRTDSYGKVCGEGSYQCSGCYGLTKSGRPLALPENALKKAIVEGAKSVSFGDGVANAIDLIKVPELSSKSKRSPYVKRKGCCVGVYTSLFNCCEEIEHELEKAEREANEGVKSCCNKCGDCFDKNCKCDCRGCDIFCCYTDCCAKPCLCGDVNRDGYLVTLGGPDNTLYSCRRVDILGNICGEGTYQCPGCKGLNLAGYPPMHEKVVQSKNFLIEGAKNLKLGNEVVDVVETLTDKTDVVISGLRVPSAIYRSRRAGGCVATYNCLFNCCAEIENDIEAAEKGVEKSAKACGKECCKCFHECEDSAISGGACCCACLSKSCDVFCCFTDKCRKPLCCGDVNREGYLVELGTDNYLYHCGRLEPSGIKCGEKSFQCSACYGLNKTGLPWTKSVQEKSVDLIGEGIKGAKLLNDGATVQQTADILLAGAKKFVDEKKPAPSYAPRRRGFGTSTYNCFCECCKDVEEDFNSAGEAIDKSAKSCCMNVDECCESCRSKANDCCNETATCFCSCCCSSYDNEEIIEEVQTTEVLTVVDDSVRTLVLTEVKIELDMINPTSDLFFNVSFGNKWKGPRSHSSHHKEKFILSSKFYAFVATAEERKNELIKIQFYRDHDNRMLCTGECHFVDTRKEHNAEEHALMKVELIDAQHQNVVVGHAALYFLVKDEKFGKEVVYEKVKAVESTACCGASR